MLASRVLEVAIGLVLIYFLFSLLCSAINEWIARFVGLRAISLHDAIEKLLDKQHSGDFYTSFHNSAVIKALLPLKTPLLVRRWNKFKDRALYPSYIPATTFALAVFDCALEVNAAAGTASTRDNSPPIIKSLLKDVDGDLVRVRTRLESWFDDSMERVSGKYKRMNQVILLGVAAVAALVFNVDTVSIAQRLYGDPAVRAALVNQANTIVAKHPNDLAGVERDLDKELAKVRDFGLPVGWESNCNPISHGKDSCRFSLLNLLGIVLSALALSQGAPFWFDVLNKASNLRQTGVPPDEQKKK